MRATTARMLVPLLTRQESVLHRRQLQRHGLADDLIDHEVRAGRWTRLAPEVVLAGRGPASERQLARAALLHGGSASALTGRIACRVWGLRDVPEHGPVSLLLPHEVRRTAVPGVHVQRTTRRPPRYAVDGLAVVSPDQAVADAARDGAALREVRALVLAAVADGAVDLGRLRHRLDDGPRRGSAFLRIALADAEAGAASAPEAELAGLLGPVLRRRRVVVLLNPTLRVDGVLLGRVDLYLPALALGVEVDSRRHHAGVDDLDATLRRHARFAAAGVRLLHLTPRRIRAFPQEVVAEVLLAASVPWPLPSGVVVHPHAVPTAGQ